MKNILLSLTLLATLSGGASYGATLATVNGKKITDQDFMANLNQVGRGQREKISSSPKLKQQALQNLINQELIVQEGNKEKITDSAEFKAALEVLKDQLVSKMVIEKKIENQINATSIKNYYSKNKLKFSTEQAHVYHVLLPTLDEAKKVLAMVQAPNADFLAIAEKHSKDPTVKNNRGDIGFVSRGQMVPEFEEAVFLAKKGQIVGPVQTEFGFHVVKIVDHVAGKILGFNEVEMQAENALRAELLRTFVAGLRAKAQIKLEAKN